MGLIPDSAQPRPALRTAAETDLPAIVAIYNSTIPSRKVTADTRPVTVASRFAWFRAHDPKRLPIWVVDDPENGGICAWISFSVFYGRPAYDATAEVSLYVSEGRRRQGWGRHLLGEAVARAPDFGMHTLLGLIFGHNEPSLRLFGKFGFERWGTLPRVAVLDGVERDLIIVGRRVTCAR